MAELDFLSFATYTLGTCSFEKNKRTGREVFSIEIGIGNLTLQVKNCVLAN